MWRCNRWPWYCWLGPAAVTGGHGGRAPGKPLSHSGGACTYGVIKTGVYVALGREKLHLNVSSIDGSSTGPAHPNMVPVCS